MNISFTGKIRKPYYNQVNAMPLVCGFGPHIKVSGEMDFILIVVEVSAIQMFKKPYTPCLPTDK